MQIPEKCEAKVEAECPVHGPLLKRNAAMDILQHDPENMDALKQFFTASTLLSEQEKKGFIEVETKQAAAQATTASVKPHYLSVRLIQPGNVQAFRESEIRFTNEFVSTLPTLLGEGLQVETALKGKKAGARAGRVITIRNQQGQLLYTLEEHPSDLRDIYGRNAETNRPQGLLPELKLTDAKTKRYMYFEVKEQGSQGNAHERGYKLFTAKFANVLQARTKLPYHAYRIVMYKSLSKDRRYINEFQHLLEADQYILAEDKQDLQAKMGSLLNLLGKRTPASSK